MARQQEGFGAMEMTVWQGARWSVANAYLRPALKRPNLQLVTRAPGAPGDPRRAQGGGVEYERGGKVERAAASREIVLAASAINSPKLLLLSGIGNAADVKAAGIAPAASSAGGRPEPPGSSRNLFPAAQQGAGDAQFQARLDLEGADRRRMAVLPARPRRHQSFRDPAASSARAPGVEYPDIQYHFLPGAIRYDGKAAAPGHGFQVHVGPMRSRSRGSVTLRSGEPREPPRIRFNYMSHPSDWEDFRRCIRLTREMFRQPAMQRYAGTRNSARRSNQSTTRPSTASSASIARAPFTPAAPAAWAVPTTRWRWSTRNAGSSASRGCGWPIPRSSRRSPTATSTRPRS